MKYYRKKNVQPMYPYTSDAYMEGVSISEGDILEVGGMIAFNPDNPTDRWYIAKKFFEDNYEEVS